LNPTTRRQLGIALMAGGLFGLLMAILYLLPFVISEMATITLGHARIVEICLSGSLVSYGAGWACWRGPK